MGFNKRYVNLKSTIHALNDNSLKQLYGKSDMFIFEDTFSSKVYNMFGEGKSEQQIKDFLKSESINEKNFQEN